MAGVTPEKNDDPWARRLKLVPIEQIETAIAEALGRLVGCEYEASVSSLDFEPGPHADHSEIFARPVDRDVIRRRDLPCSRPEFRLGT